MICIIRKVPNNYVHTYIHAYWRLPRTPQSELQTYVPSIGVDSIARINMAFSSLRVLKYEFESESEFKSSTSLLCISTSKLYSRLTSESQPPSRCSASFDSSPLTYLLTDLSTYYRGQTPLLLKPLIANLTIRK